MPDQRPRLLLADDHPLLLSGLETLLEPEFEVVGTATDGEALVEAAVRLRPDLVIADISMHGVDGIEAARRLREAVPEARIVILSVHAEASWVREAFDAGAWGYLTKASAAEELRRAIREVLAGRFYISPWVARAAVGRDPGEPPAERLTPRELDICRLVGRGLGNQEIARHLGVAVTTVRSHLRSVYDKLALASRVELALHASVRGDDRSRPAGSPVEAGS